MNIKRNLEENDDDKSKRFKMNEPEPSRALFFGNIDPQQVSYYDICKIANQYGALELVNIVAARYCAFVNFVSEEGAKALYDESQRNTIKIMEKEVAIRWGKAKAIAPDLLTQIEAGATRNLFIANIPPGITHSQLHHVFSRFGDIENVVVIANKGIAFVNMVSVKAAINALETCHSTGIDIQGKKLKMNFAKEGVPARDPRQIVEQQPASRPPPSAYGAPPSGHGGPYSGPGYGQQGGMMPPQHAYTQELTNPRSIFLGNVPDSVQYSDICKLANKYGRLELAKRNREKQNAFLNFLDPESALAMFEDCRMYPPVLADEKVKVNWAKSSPLRQEMLGEIQRGATRNLFVGGIKESTTEADLQELFAPYCGGDFDTISVLSEKKIAFVNMVSLKAAIMARQALTRNGPCLFQGEELKINFAKEATKRATHFGAGGGPAGGSGRGGPPGGGAAHYQPTNQQQPAYSGGSPGYGGGYQQPYGGGGGSHSQPHYQQGGAPPQDHPRDSKPGYNPYGGY